MSLVPLKCNIAGDLQLLRANILMELGSVETDNHLVLVDLRPMVCINLKDNAE